MARAVVPAAAALPFGCALAAESAGRLAAAFHPGPGALEGRCGLDAGRSRRIDPWSGPGAAFAWAKINRDPRPSGPGKKRETTSDAALRAFLDARLRSERRLAGTLLAGSFAVPAARAQAPAPRRRPPRPTPSTRCGAAARWSAASTPASPASPSRTARASGAGFDVDYCRAIAAALFGDANKVRYVPTTAQNRFTALQSGEVDVLARNTTWTLSRDTSPRLRLRGGQFLRRPGLHGEAQHSA